MTQENLREQNNRCDSRSPTFFDMYPVDGYFNRLEKGQDKKTLVNGSNAGKIVSMDVDGNVIGEMGVIEDYDRKTGMAKIKLWPSIIAPDGSRLPNINFQILIDAGIPIEHIIFKNLA